MYNQFLAANTYVFVLHMICFLCFSNCKIYIKKYNNFRLSHLPMKHFSSFEICFPKHYETNKTKKLFIFKQEIYLLLSWLLSFLEHKVNTHHFKLDLSSFSIFLFLFIQHVNEQTICYLIKTLLAYRIQVFNFRNCIQG